MKARADARPEDVRRSVAGRIAAGYHVGMNDTSRRLRYTLGVLCDRYNTMLADKDTVDFRLGTPEPYESTVHGIDAEKAYVEASQEVSSELRTIIVDIAQTAQDIRDIERF